MAKRTKKTGKELTRQIKNLRRRVARLRKRLGDSDCDPGAPGEFYSAPALKRHILGQIRKLEKELTELERQRKRLAAR